VGVVASFKARPLVWIVAAVVVVALGVFAGVQLNKRIREDAYVAAIRTDPRATLSTDLTDDQLRSGLEYQCKQIAAGVTPSRLIATSLQNWGGVEAMSKVTREQFIANGLVFYEAAKPNC